MDDGMACLWLSGLPGSITVVVQNDTESIYKPQFSAETPLPKE